MRLDFTLCDLSGCVEVVVEANTDPERLGCDPAARDFPVCTATVTYAGRGYMAALGWVQLVRSTDGASGGKHFEMDPVAPLGQQTHPFCWFGFAPTLFDAPSRETRDPIDWTAHSFLGFIGEHAHGLEVRAILGFGWRFAIRDQAISLEPPAALASAAWDRHLAILNREHPTWDFAAGYRDR